MKTSLEQAGKAVYSLWLVIAGKETGYFLQLRLRHPAANNNADGKC
ncbi:MAG TPA: hypothetical protein PLA68_06625 [Panacibacter sp.]|nr:hypothetical protein [Panacibacter sp.]